MPEGAPKLSDYAGGKVIVFCECGITKQYDADAMRARIGDERLTALLERLASVLECPKAGANDWGGDIRAKMCQLRYDIERMGGYRGRNLR
jgi:hypothetical protein